MRQVVYLVKDYEDAPNMYVRGVFSSRSNAENYIAKLEEADNDTYFEIKVAEYEIDSEGY